MRVLVAGWFSFECGHATAGDLLAGGVVCAWLAATGIDHDVALVPALAAATSETDARAPVDLAAVDPARYTHVVFVCGPFERGELEGEILGRFGGCRLIGVDLSMAEPLASWNPFDLLLERDSSATVRPDLVFASRRPLVPVVGLCLVEPHPGARTAEAEAAIRRTLAGRRLAVVPIDTRLDTNAAGLRDPGEVESLIARMDAVVTTRLHGMVLALKHGVPALVVDPIPGGAKIARQAAAIGWPAVFVVDRLDDAALREGLDACLGAAARAQAADCAARARRAIEAVRTGLLDALAGDATLEGRFRARLDRGAPRDDGPRPAPRPTLIERVRGRVLRGGAHGRRLRR